MSKKRVKIRQRLNANGTTTLVLDYFKNYDVINGKRVQNRIRKKLPFKLVTKPRSPIDKENNKNLMEKARLIAIDWEKDLINDEFDLKDKSKENSIVTKFIDKVISQKQGQAQTSYVTLKSHLQNYFPLHTTFKQLNKVEKLNDFYLSYLKQDAKGKSGNPLKSSSYNKVFSSLKTVLKQAKNEKYINSNEAENVQMDKTEIDPRIYLEREEVKKLVHTDCKYPIVKKAFIFSIYTGLRFGDIEKLKWGDITIKGDKWECAIQVQKSKKPFYLSIPSGAIPYMGKKNQSEDLVFTGLTYKEINFKLKRWALRSGVTKDITFHSARHTFAMDEVERGTDTYTLKEMMGHTKIDTTMRYYHIRNEAVKGAFESKPTYE
jgi:integrase